MRSNWSRRDFLGGFGSISLVGLAGCADQIGSGHGATDVVLHNEANERRTVDLTVRKPDSESANIDRSIELESNSRETINNEVIMGSDYDVEVTFTDTTMDSPYTETQEWNDARQPLHIILHKQAVFAVQIG